MNILSFLKSERRKREEIVTRLLDLKQITATEATLLLKTIERISIQKLELSSGASLVMGDDNHSES